MFDTIYIKDKQGNKVSSGIGHRGIIFEANKFEKAETYKEAVEVLERQGLTVSKLYSMV